MRKHNIYQDAEAARLNAIQCVRENNLVKHAIYGERKNYDSPMIVYAKPVVFCYDETYQQYIDTNPAQVLYTIHSTEEY